ncbi:MAG: hypothetical protein NO516_00745 [Candidatus Methanomethylicia archaeon]|nr:hypothetical protein [Candidatus Methanomethylicia archaeon]
MRLIVYSAADPAGRNIASHLSKMIGLAPSKEIRWDGRPIEFLEYASSLVEMSVEGEGIEWALLLSRHKSASGKKCLTVHTPGNLSGSADLGGRPRSVSISNPALQSALLRGLKASRDELSLEIQVTVEATHHGPTELRYPVTFIEIGSDENAWVDEALGEAVARAIVKAVFSGPSTPKGRSAVGVGGGHYSEKFTDAILSGVYDMGHIVPKYALSEVPDISPIAICVGRTLGGCQSLVVDWKGVPSAYKALIKDFSGSTGIELVRV